MDQAESDCINLTPRIIIINLIWLISGIKSFRNKLSKSAIQVHLSIEIQTTIVKKTSLPLSSNTINISAPDLNVNFCSVLQLGLLGEAHSTCAQYLFQQDKIYDVSYDKGDKSLQCGRKMDAFKLWVRKLIACFLL